MIHSLGLNLTYSIALFHGVGGRGVGQGVVEDYEAGDAGQQRTGHNAQLGMVEVVGLGGGASERKRGDEQRHGEADAAKQSNRGYHLPVAVSRHGSEPELYREPRE